LIAVQMQPTTPALVKTIGRTNAYHLASAMAEINQLASALKCIGTPRSSYVVGSSTEVWAYNSAAQNAGTAPECVVKVMMQRAQVIDVDYLGPSGGFLPKGKQCAYAVENCIK